MSRTRADLKEGYLRWLEPQLRDEHSLPDRSFLDLLNVMYEKEFVVVVPMDDNRMEDGLDLRVLFANERHIRRDLKRELGTCSFLEVLIGLSRRMGFVAGGEPPGWAWHLLSNLELHRMSDPLTRRKYNKAQEILDIVMMRRYSPDGTGGFFPLAWPDEDQTKVELWYQMNAYIEELHPEH